MNTVTVVDCGHGNLGSVRNALRHLGAPVNMAANAAAVMNASCLLFPGQGAAAPAMASLTASGMDVALTERVLAGVPCLGICLGMQLALTSSDEGPTTCLGLGKGRSLPFRPHEGLKVPQIGWNTVSHDRDPLFAGILDGSYFYFVHSYYCVPEASSVIGRTQFGVEYASALRTGSFWATQFHPEKSGQLGLQLLRNFLDLAGC